MDPDLLVLQECENEDKLKASLVDLSYNQIIWYGKNQHKGVAVISFNKVQVTLDKNFNLDFEYVVPLKLKISHREIRLFCIWAMPHKTIRAQRYIGQVWCAINFYESYFKEECILIGDFNSNAIWDEKKRIGNHTDVVEFLEEKEIKSIYHSKYKQEHGKEVHPTLYLLKNKEKPYHIDYCFLSKSLFNKKTNITIGSYDEWIKLSDHMPIIVDKIYLN